MKRTLLLVVLLLGTAGVASVASATGEPTAEQAFNTTTPDPGETVEVTVTVDLPEPGSVDYAGSFEPEFEHATFRSVTSGDEQILPLLQEFTPGAGIVSVPAENTDAGQLEITFHVAVPEDAEAGTTFSFDESAIQVDEEPVPIEGQFELTVGGPDSGTATFDVEIDDTASDTEITAGDDLSVTATVTNTGDGAGTGDVRFEVDGIESDRNTVNLDLGETSTLEFTHATAVDQTDPLDVAVITADGEATLSVSVRADDDGEPGANGDDDDGFGPGFGPLVVLVGLIGLAARGVHNRSN